ncbi:low affinity immunoglobulin epsilon Fc receptor-like [Crassostrea angulata]|uniref:low affinity immunoglobulin epsilon Fc receptor-like n=1 Tax=Magallana angulata TaxID=2784310 RepID=UPI0022B09891|nr:low affinity immunoglobulin epsilon Fc receptor-like [Crassostrea angulata]
MVHSVSSIVEMKTVSVICGLALCLFNVIAAQRLYDSEYDGNLDIRYVGEEMAKLRKLFVDEMAKIRLDINTSRVQQSNKDIRYNGEEMAKLRTLFVQEMAEIRLDINTSRVQQSNMDIRCSGEEMAKLRTLFVEKMAKIRLDINSSRIQQGNMDIRYEGEMAKLRKLFVEEMAKIRLDINTSRVQKSNMDIRYEEEMAKLRKLFVDEMAKIRLDINTSRVQQSEARKQYTEEEMTTVKETCVAEMAKLGQSTKFPQSCPTQWVPYQNSCYFFGNDYGNWNQGKVKCEQKHGSSKYVRITSQEEDTFLRNFVRSRNITEYASRDYWIGGTDASRDGEFMWEGHSQSFTWTNWGPGNPDRVGTSDCVILFQRSDYKWHDTSCSNSNSYICEIEF